jgi:anti-sigma regulatory factor (Ser/Thr protein kinase)
VSADLSVPVLSLTVPATAEWVAEIRDRVRRFAAEHGAGALELAAIALAVSEAAANAVRHAYPDGPGEIRVMADVEDAELEIVLVDDGRGFRTGLQGGPGLGLGLALMRRDAAAFEIRDRPLGGVEVWLRFALDR